MNNVLKLRREATLSSSWSYMVDVKFDSILFQLRRIESHYFGAKLEDIEAKCSGLWLCLTFLHRFPNYLFSNIFVRKSLKFLTGLISCYLWIPGDWMLTRFWNSAMLAFAMPSSTFLQMRATVIGTQDVDTIPVKEAISEVHEISVSKRGKKQKLRYEKEFHALANIAYFRNKCLTLGLVSKVKVF